MKFIAFLILFSINLYAQETIPATPQQEHSVPIPINMVSQIPLPESCKSVPKEFEKDCLLKTIELHISTHLQYPEEAKKQNVMARVFTTFTINKQGYLENVQAKSNTNNFRRAFENEAIRVVGLLPRFIPGENEGEKVVVSVMLPVEFLLGVVKVEVPESELITGHSVMVPSEDIVPEPIPFAVVEQIPLFSSCENTDKKQQMACFQEALKKHIDKNLKYPKAAKKQKSERKVLVMFTINEDGTIADIRVKPLRKDSFDTLFEQEAKRVVKAIPTLIPAKQRGKLVAVRYATPIVFKL